MAVVSPSSVVVSWPSTEAPRPRKHNEGQAHMGARSAASDPWSACVWWLFSECEALSFVLHFFLLFLVQLKFPEGRAKNKATGQRIPWFFTPQRSVLSFWKFKTQRGTKAMREEGEHGSGGRRVVACVAAVHAHVPGETSPSPPWTLSFVTGHPPLPRGRLLYSGSRAERAPPCPMRSSLYDIV